MGVRLTPTGSAQLHLVAASFGGVTRSNLVVTAAGGVERVTSGGTATYTVVVRNVGTEPAVGAAVAAAVPAGLTGVTFTSAAACGATGNSAARAGTVADTFTLPPGATVTYTVTGTVLGPAGGAVTYTATPAGGAADLNPADNSAAATITLAATPLVVGGAADASALVFAPGPGGQYTAAPTPVSPFGGAAGAFRGGARPPLGDVNRDGKADVAVAAGFGGGPRTALFDGTTVLGGAPTRLLGDFVAFPGAAR